MLTFIILGVILLVGLIIFIGIGGYDGEMWGAALIAIGGVLLMSFLILLPANRVSINAKIERIETVREEIESIHIKSYITEFNEFTYKSNPQIDRLIVKAIEENQWIRSNRYFKQNPFCNWFIPNTINEIEYIDISKLKDAL